VTTQTIMDEWLGFQDCTLTSQFRILLVLIVFNFFAFLDFFKKKDSFF
jgi:phosphatidylglycerophosphatase A